MTIPDRKMLETDVDHLRWMITDDGSRTLHDSNLDETYHNGCGAVAESMVVYVRNSGVWQRLAQGQPTRVLEVGFGTGTACLLTAACAEYHQTPLEFYSIENCLLPVELFRSLELCSAAQSYLGQDVDGWEDLPAERFLKHLGRSHESLVAFLTELKATSKGMHSSPMGDFSRLQLWHGHAEDFPADSMSGKFDAVYFDPFAPATNPELWSSTMFEVMFGVLRGQGNLASYCVKSKVRRDLAGVGFEVRRLPGPTGGKREVLVATKPTQR